MKRLIVLVGTAVALFGVAACSSPSGNPFPTSTTSSQADGDTTSTTTQSGSGGSLASLKPCSLLTASEAESVRLPSQGQSEKVGTSQSCEWQSDSWDVIVGTRTDQGLSEVQLNGGTLTNTSVNGRSAKQVDDGGGGCLVALAVGETQRLDIEAQGDSDANGCAEAMAVAKLVEPKLPSE